MEFLDLFIRRLASKESSASKNTIKNYISDVRHFINWYEKSMKSHFEANSATSDVISLYQKAMGAAVLGGGRIDIPSKLGVSSMKRHMSSLRKFFSVLKSEGAISYNPFDNIEPEQDETPTDYWHLRTFADYLASGKASKITVKNYISDIQGFAKWYEQAILPGLTSPLTSTGGFYLITQEVLNEYKDRLIQVQNAAPRTINRKLSSLRKYIDFAQKQGFISESELYLDPVRESDKRIIESTQPQVMLKEIKTEEDVLVKNYSSFPPFRLIQRLLIYPYLAFEIKAADIIAGIIAGTPVEGLQKLPQRLQKEIADKNALRSSLLNASGIFGVNGIQKEFYEPHKVSLLGKPLHHKIIHHARYTRPSWYHKYHNMAFVHYAHFAILIIFASAVGVALYNNLVSQDQRQASAAPTSPSRVLSFQGRLTDNLDNPITTPQQVRFMIYNDVTASGSANLWEELRTVQPDQDGIFSIVLGSDSNGNNGPDCTPFPLASPATDACEIPSTVFSDNSGTWLGVTIENTPELTPRQRIATVAYASNSEFLQGLPPITSLAASDPKTNTVLALDSSGNLTIGGDTNPAPIFQATDGQFTLSGEVLLLRTVTGTDTNVVITPDGFGKIDLTKALINNSLNGNLSPGAVEVNDKFAVLATESAVAAFMINNNTTGGDIFTASSSGTTRFTIANDGQITGSYYSVNGGIIYTTNGIFSQTTAGSGGQCLQSTGGGTPTWGTCGSGGNWNIAQGTIYPINETLDLLVGGTTTESAKFRVLNMNTGTPVASVSANSGNNATFISGGGNIGTTNRQTLTIGNASGFNTTGNVLFNSNGVGNVGFFTTTPRASFDVRGISGTGPAASISANTSFAALVIDNSGTGDFLTASKGGQIYFRMSAENGNYFGTDYDGTFTVGKGGNGKITALVVDPVIVSNQKTTGTQSLTLHTSGSTNADFIFQNVNTELARLSQAGQLSLAIQGTTGGLVIGGDTHIYRGDSNRLDLANGDSFNVVNGNIQTGGVTRIDSSGNGFFTNLTVSSCSGCGAGGFASPFQELAGAIVPLNSTLDLLIGGQSTSSAKFAVLNVAGGTPTASISANSGNNALYLTGDGTLATTNRQTLILGNSSAYDTTGNILLHPNGTGYVGIGTSAPTAKLEISNTATTTGSELITNGTFTGNANGWTLGDCAVYNSNQVTVTLTACGNPYLSTDFTTTANETYLLSFDISGANNESISFYFDNNSITTHHDPFGNGSHTIAFTTDYTGTETITFNSLLLNPNGAWTIDNVSIKRASAIVPSLTVNGFDGSTWLSIGGDIHGNTSIGKNSFQSNTSGYSNTAIGTQALMNNTDGSYNTALGTGALYTNTYGSNNTALGTGALWKNTSSYNTAIGMWALRNNSSGEYNTALGIEALSSNTTGVTNTALGAYALHKNTTGIYNIGIGGDSLYNNTIGNENIAIGLTALYNNSTGIGNTAIGMEALDGNTTGSYNVAIGAYAGGGLYSNSSGSNNTYLGYNSGPYTEFATFNNSAAIGAFALVNASNALVLGGTSNSAYAVNVGIGTATPSATLDIQGGNRGGNAALIVNQLGGASNDIITASSSGTPKFTISNTGGITSAAFTTNGGLLYTNGSGVFAQTGAGTGSQCLLGGTTPTWGSCSTGGTDSPFYSGAGFIAQNNTTLDFLLGGTATSSAKFAVLNLADTQTPVASLSAITGTNQGKGLSLGANGSIQSLRNNTLTIGGNSTGNILLDPLDGTGSIYIGETDVSISRTAPSVLSVNNQLLIKSLNSEGESIFYGDGTGYHWYAATSGTILGIANGPSLTQTGAFTGMSIDLSAGITVPNSSSGDQTGLSLSLSDGGTAATTKGIILSDTSLTGIDYGIDFSGTNMFNVAAVNLSSSGNGTAISATANAGGQAAVIINKTGVNDIFTASSSGTPKFTISNTGGLTSAAFTTNGGLLYTNGSGVFAQTGAGSGSQCLLGGTTPTWGSCGTGTTPSPFQQLSGAIVPLNSTLDTLLGGQSSASATLRVLGSQNPFAGTEIATYISSNTSAAGLVVENSGVGNILAASSSGTTRFSIDNSGNTNLFGQADLRFMDSDSSNYVAFQAPATVGSNVVWTLPDADASGCFQSNGSGSLTIATCGSGGESFWNVTNGVLHPGNSTLDLAIGGTSSTSAKFLFANVNSGIPTLKIFNESMTQSLNLFHDGTNGNITASTGTINIGVGGGTLYLETDLVNDTTSFDGAVKVADKLLVQNAEAAGTALAIFDNTGSGDILTASVSGTTRFRIANDGSILIRGGQTSDIDTLTANSLNIGVTNANAVTIGNTTGSTSLTLNSGTGAINIGTSVAKTITIGNTTGATGIDINVGSGELDLGDTASTKTIEIGGVDNSGTDTIRIATNGSAPDTIEIGNTNATLSLTGNNWNIDSSGNLDLGGILQVGNTTGTTYSRFGTGTTGHSLSGAEDLLVSGDLEVNGTAWFDGNVTITGTCTGCGGSSGGAFDVLGTGVTVQKNQTTDLLIGASSTSSAKFAVLNVNGTGPAIASVSGNFVVMPHNGAGGRLGIGTTSPTATLDIVQSRLNDTDYTGVNFDFSHTGTNDDYTYGLVSSFNKNSTSSCDYCVGGIGALFIATASATAHSYEMYGMDVSTTFTSDFNGGGGSGGFGIINSLRTAPNQYSTDTLTGFNNSVFHQATGTLANAYASYDLIQTFNGRITNAYGNRIGISSSGGGSITTAYGLYLGTISATNEYGVYQTDSSNLNYFSGKIGLGEVPSASTGQLHVTRPLSSGVTGKALAVFNQIENQDIFSASSSGITRFVLTNSGSIGLGLTDAPVGKLRIPEAKLDVYSSLGTDPVASFSGRTSDAVLKIVQNGSGDLIVASKSGATFFRVTGTSGDDGGTPFAGELHVGLNATGKIYAGVQDPPYTIDGIKFATYAPSVLGLYEEFIGKTIIEYNEDLKAYAHKLDFNNFEPHSDLWVFNRIIDQDVTDIKITMTPNSNARTWYKKDGTNRSIILYSDRPTEISYRLSALRFNHGEYPTLRNSGPIGYIPPPPATTGDASGNNNISADPFFNTLVINHNNGQWRLYDANNNELNFVEAYSKAIIANIQAGLVNAQQITTNGFNATTGFIGNLTGNSLTFVTGSFNNITAAVSNLGNATANTLAITTNNVTIAGQSLSAYIEGVVANYLAGQPISPLASSETIETNVLSPLADTSAPSISLQNSRVNIDDGDTTVSWFDREGNASFSGTLTSNRIVTNEASVSGNLAAGNIQTENITTTDASVSGTLRTNNLIADNIQGLDEKIGTLAAVLSGNYQNTSSGSGEYSTLFAGIVNATSINAEFGIFEHGITSMGPVTASHITAIDTLAVGSNLTISNNAINTLGAELAFQSLRQADITFQGGLIRMDTDGNMEIAGNLNLLGEIDAVYGIFSGSIIAPALATNLITPLPGNDITLMLTQKSASNSARFIVANNNGQEVLSINDRGDITSSGAATLAKLNFSLVGEAQASSLTEAIATGSAGFATLRAYQPEITIKNPNITPDSLIYITPFGDTDKVLYLLRQTPQTEDEEGSFTVGASGTLPTQNIQFNWLIVN